MTLTFKFFVHVLKISVSCFLIRNEIFSKNSKQMKIFLKKLLIKTLSCLWHLLTLSTNIPLDETIDICVDMIYNKRKNVKVMLKRHFKQLLMLSVKSSFSFFNGVYYKQIDSVAMGSPLGPTLANIFLTYCEDSWLDNLPIQFRPRYYRSYVDDVFLIYERKHQVKKFLRYMNSRHPNIQFTCEGESNNKTSFLDVSIKRMNNKLVTPLYRKKTCSGVYMNYNNFSAFKV